MWFFIIFNVKERGINYVLMVYEKYILFKYINFYFGLLVVNFKISE